MKTFHERLPSLTRSVQNMTTVGWYIWAQVTFRNQVLRRVVVSICFTNWWVVFFFSYIPSPRNERPTFTGRGVIVPSKSPTFFVEIKKKIKKHPHELHASRSRQNFPIPLRTLIESYCYTLLIVYRRVHGSCNRIRVVHMTRELDFSDFTLTSFRVGLACWARQRTDCVGS
jgi:hypothetical protein